MKHVQANPKTQSIAGLSRRATKWVDHVGNGSVFAEDTGQEHPQNTPFSQQGGDRAAPPNHSNPGEQSARVGHEVESAPSLIQAVPADKPHVLIVDDNEPNRKLLTYQLNRMGYSTSTACDGVEALEAFDPQWVHLVLLDLRMPRMDGIDTAKHLRADHGLALPIIGLTAGMGVDQNQSFREAGVNEIVFKPIRMSDLETCLAAYLAPSAPVAPAEPTRTKLDDLRDSFFQ